MRPSRLEPFAFVNHLCASFQHMALRVIGGEDENAFDLINAMGGDMSTREFHRTEADSK